MVSGISPQAAGGTVTNIRAEIDALNATINSLILTYPELQDDETLRADTFEGCSSLNEVLSRLLDMGQEAKAMAQAVKLRMDDIAARKARYERQEEGFRTLIQSVMERANLSKVTLPEATLSISHIKPAPIIADEAAIPDALCKFKRSPDMAAIKDAVSNGNMPPGVNMSNGRSTLSIRPK